MKPKADKIYRAQCKTKAGHTLSFFYNPDNNLLCVDLVHWSEKGGHEIVRQTLNEQRLLSHIVA